MLGVIAPPPFFCNKSLRQFRRKLLSPCLAWLNPRLKKIHVPECANRFFRNVETNPLLPSFWLWYMWRPKHVSTLCIASPGPQFKYWRFLLRNWSLVRRKTGCACYTYLLTPWCRVLLEKLTGLQLVKKFPAFHGTRRFITALTSFRHLSLSWASPIQSIHTHPTSWRSILILYAHLFLGLPSGLLPSGFPTKTLYTPLSSPTRATWPVHRYK